MADKKRLDAVIKRIVQALRRRKRIIVHFESPKEALVQAILARGDRRLAEPLIRAAAGRGAKDLVPEMKADGLAPEDYLMRAWARDDYLPWGASRYGLYKAFSLWQEYMRAQALKATPACFNGCERCGVCRSTERING